MTLPAWLRNGTRNPTTPGAVIPMALFCVALTLFWVFVYQAQPARMLLALYAMVGLACWGPAGSSQTDDD